jgi:hypothetical protein
MLLEHSPSNLNRKFGGAARIEPGMEVLEIERGRESCCLVLVFGLSSSPVCLL